MENLKRLSLLFSMLFAAMFASGTFQEAKAQNRGLINQAEKISGDSFTVTTTTPLGVRVYAVKHPRAAILRAVDDGLTDLFAVARRHGYRARLNHSDYTIFIARPDRTRDGSGNYSPDIAVSANQYAGSVYDQGGYIYAAGMIVTFNPGAFLIAEHDRNLQRVSEVVRYEGEHIVLYHNDRRLFKRAADHSQGGGHPILD